MLFFLLGSYVLLAQDEQRLNNIKNNLEILSVDNAGLTENLKLDINVTNVSLTNFLVAVSNVHNLNITVSPELSNINIINNFSDVTVADLLLFLCKEYNLDIDFTGNILSIKPYVPEQKPPREKEIKVFYNPVEESITMDLKNDNLDKVFRKIIDESGKNLLYSSGMENLPLNLYIKEVAFDKAMQNLAASNNLEFSKSRDGFYLFSGGNINASIPEGNRMPPQNRPLRTSANSNFYYEIIDTTSKMLNVNFKNVPVANIVNEIGYDLNLDIYTASPLENAGNVSFKARQITFDDMLDKIFESAAATPISQQSNGANQQNQNGLPPGQFNTGAHFTYKKEGNIYFFGTADQLSVRIMEIVTLKHRSIEMLGDPSTSGGSSGRMYSDYGGFQNYYGGSANSAYNNQQYNSNSSFNSTQRQSLRTNTSSAFTSDDSKLQAIVDIIPDEVKQGLDIKVDRELNSFFVSGSSMQVDRFKKIIGKIDKPVPVVLIEVMFLEVGRNSTVETGISWGIGDEPVKTSGGIFPTTDFTMGAETVNKVIGGFDGFGSFNLGKVVPEFFVTIKAMEQSGNLKVLSTPKISTLNGHRATFSNNETSYYAVTAQNFYGSQIPQTSEIKNYVPIDAGLTLSIKPFVSGDGQVTLDLFVTQSTFTGERIDEDAPPGLNSREFSSIIRMRDQDIAVLGGLDQKLTNNSGSGVPFLARIPIIRWFFSKRVREASKKKLTVLIKPTIIN
ncbi:type II secretion system protein GspD [Abyssalbus ytuae]|uniref:General secretion pathway protein GspD n=1 Tax=Abyssalbus ytuae TaxID=2926907 RepID=A0A9E6ZW41_9FLAO|nr:general secretion pathway protein GspD [Abyssalbus ytuae]UOB17881.1 general secretion pathway protein GspD [Abyssalbus ytuae]